MKKKIFCFILCKFFKESQGGAELQCYYLARELISRGWEVHYIREYRFRNFPEEYQEQGIFIHAIPQVHQQLRFLNTPALFRVMGKIRADFWYCRGTISYLYPVLRNAGKLQRGKVIWACSHDKELKGVTAKNCLSQAAWKLNQFMFKTALPKTDHILLQTHDQLELLKMNFRLTGTVLYNAHPRTKDRATVKNDRILLWIGRLQTWKHPEIFIKLARHFNGRPYRFIAIGKPLKGNSLEGLLKQADRALPNFKYTGELDNVEVRGLLRKAKVLVCTSKYEGFSNTFIEAWARGVPVISSNVNPDNLLTVRHLGVLSNSFDQLCQDVERFMNDDPFWSHVSESCIRFFTDHLTVDAAVDKLESILRQETGHI